jgi:NAD(P)-dependent dehydrogenase (short-subunit alcohol dehydrogenase family)
MVESWVLKRWDLRHKVSLDEAQRTVLEFVEQGITHHKKKLVQSDLGACVGKKALLINAGTLLCSSICRELLARGAEVFACVFEDQAKVDLTMDRKELSKGLHLFTQKRRENEEALLQKILNKCDHYDFYIHDIGMGYTGQQTPKTGMLQENLSVANLITPAVYRKMRGAQPKRVVLLGPWGWDRYTDPFIYETVRSGVVALARALSRIQEPGGATINCITPGFIAGGRPSSVQNKYGAAVEGEIPLGVLGKVHNVTEAIFYLLKDSSGYLTGQELKISGGAD